MITTLLNTTDTQDVFELIQDIYGFEIELEELTNQVEAPLLNRLNKWFRFFNENYSFCLCYYEQTVFALIEAAKNNELFREQTACEFELSLAFYQKLFRLNVFIKITTITNALKLLSFSLIFGKYPGMLLGSINKSLSVLSKGFNQHNLEILFDTLFVKYEVPTFFIKHIHLLSSLEIEALMFVLQGHNIRKFKGIPYQISRKESYILINALPDNLAFEDRVLERAFICSKMLLGKPKNIMLLNFFLDYSTTFKDDCLLFYKDIQFWQSAFVLVCDALNSEYHLGVQEYVDYFEYKKYVDPTAFSLKGRSADSITTSVNRWHGNLGYQNTKKVEKLSWVGSKFSETHYKYKGHSYLFKEITTGKDLLLESQKLEHCVASYAEKCFRGETTIWSLRKEINGVYVPFITIEIIQNYIVQMYGKRNRKVTPIEYHLIKQWAANKEIKIGGAFRYD
jgi:PcfJ-like protein